MSKEGGTVPSPLNEGQRFQADDLGNRFLTHLKSLPDDGHHYEVLLNAVRAGLGRFYPIEGFTPAGVLPEKTEYIMQASRRFNRLLVNASEAAADFPETREASELLSRRSDRLFSIFTEASELEVTGEIEGIVSGNSEQTGLTEPLKKRLNGTEKVILHDLIVGKSHADPDKARIDGAQLVDQLKDVLPEDRRKPQNTVGSDFLEALMSLNLE